MHFEHPAGEKVFIDYAGKKLHVTDPDTGEYVPAEVFVATLGCSQYTYVEATYSQKKPDFIQSCRRMLEFFVREGNKISAEGGAFLAKLMEAIPHPEQGYRSCLGILNLARKVDTRRISRACQRAAEYGVYSCSMVEQILSKNLDTIPFADEQLDESSQMPKHHNIRGNKYFS